MIKTNLSRPYTYKGRCSKYPDYTYRISVAAENLFRYRDPVSPEGASIDCVDYEFHIDENVVDFTHTLRVVLLPNVYPAAREPMVAAQTTIRCIELLRADNWLYMRVKLAELAEGVFRK